MTAEIIKQIIARAVAEQAFRELLLSDPAKALEGYELTPDERATLQGLTPQEFEALGSELEERVSRAQQTPFNGRFGSAYCGAVTNNC